MCTVCLSVCELFVFVFCSVIVMIGFCRSHENPNNDMLMIEYWYSKSECHRSKSRFKECFCVFILKHWQIRVREDGM